MTKKVAFDNKKYLNDEFKILKKRASKFDKLYLEIGGHLLKDNHASRVLPGYNPKNKLNLVKKFGKKAGIIYCVNSIELKKNRTWGNTNNLLESIIKKEIKALQKEVEVIGICFNLFKGQKEIVEVALKLSKKLIVPVYFTNFIKNYPDLRSAFSKFGFDNQPLINTNKKIIVVTGAGANNGKMFFCLSQIYHLENKKINAGYAKIESFPVWDLEINHEINLAYEAATADINDKVLIDPFYKKEYGKKVVNYNRDIDAFPVLKKIITKLTNKNNFMRTYKSPTEMGLNAIKDSIIDDNTTRQASIKEIKNRRKSFEKLKNKSAVKRINKIIKENKL
jgi:uncharacterized protein (UPF0371 family)